MALGIYPANGNESTILAVPAEIATTVGGPDGMHDIVGFLYAVMFRNETEVEPVAQWRRR